MQNWRHLEGDEAPVKRYLMTDAYKERSPKDESKSLLKVAATYSPTTQCSTIGDAVSLCPLRSLSRARALSRAPQARTAHTPHRPPPQTPRAPLKQAWRCQTEIRPPGT